MTISALKTKPLWTFLLLIALFGIPMAVAWFMADRGDMFGDGTVNRGQLIQPPLDLHQLNLQIADGTPLTPHSLQGRWLMLYISPSACDQLCQTNLYNMRQIRKATGKNMDRIQRAILTFNDSPSDSHLSTLLNSEYAGTFHLIVNKKAFAEFVQNSPAVGLALKQGSLYLVDPIGNVMMQYNANADPSGIYKDLTRLLKVSQIG